MKTYYALLLTLCVLVGCENDDDVPVTFMLEEAGINIVYADGGTIAPGACIDPSQSYAVKIIVSPGMSSGTLEPTKIEYTVNGNTSSTTFTDQQPRIINITLIDGENIVQLQNSGISDSVFLFGNQEFEIVF